MKQSILFKKMANLKCPLHCQEMEYVDLSIDIQNTFRTLCENCDKNNQCVNKNDFHQYCLQLIDTKNSEIEKIKQKFINTFEEIYLVLKSLQEKIIEKVFKLDLDVEVIKELEKGFSKGQSYKLKEFEHLASIVSQEKHKIELNDQKVAESNQYLDLAEKLKIFIKEYTDQNSIHKGFLNNNNNKIIFQQSSAQKCFNETFEQNLKQKQKSNSQTTIEIDKSEKLQTKISCPIANIELNYDETILAVRFAETERILQFWMNDVEEKKWKNITNLQCYEDRLVEFHLSKTDNSFISIGANKNDNKYQYSIKFWRFHFDNKNNFHFDQQMIYSVIQNRIQCIAINNLSRLILAGQGACLVAFSSNLHGQFNQEQCKSISSEIINTISFSQNNIFGVGSYDYTVYIMQFIGKQFEIIQKIKLIGVPKTILFGINDIELFILQLDGILVINRKQEQKIKYIDAQKIVNNENKIRAIQLNQKKFLALGGESNILEIWQKNKLIWQCINQRQQDEFLESICFSNKDNFIISSSKSEIIVHSFKEVLKQKIQIND